MLYLCDKCMPKDQEELTVGVLGGVGCIVCHRVPAKHVVRGDSLIDFIADVVITRLKKEEK